MYNETSVNTNFTSVRYNRDCSVNSLGPTLVSDQKMTFCFLCFNGDNRVLLLAQLGSVVKRGLTVLLDINNAL